MSANLFEFFLLIYEVLLVTILFRKRNILKSLKIFDGHVARSRIDKSELNEKINSHLKPKEKTKICLFTLRKFLQKKNLANIFPDFDG
jgi:hypothetical protein